MSFSWPKVVLAPMAGGVTTVGLVAAVTEAGGLGFLAAGYKRVDAVVSDLATARAAVSGPLGLNIFVPGSAAAGDGDKAIASYAQTLAGEAAAHGVALGEPRFEDDDYAAKIELALRERPQIVSFTFGLRAADAERLKRAGIDVWATVTSPGEAAIATAVGVDALVVQGTEAGGHRGFWNDDVANEEYGLITLLRLVRAASSLPLIAAGGIVDRESAAAAFAAGAAAVQVGTAFMLADEAGTAAAHREALKSGAGTALTRAFTGRTARGIVNRFMQEHEADAVHGYPQVHHLTAPLRAAAKAAGDDSAFHLWAGQGYHLVEPLPAAEIVRRLTP